MTEQQRYPLSWPAGWPRTNVRRQAAFCKRNRIEGGWTSKVLFVGLNPSTANATQDDPTIRRCVGFARAWGFDWLYMGNLNAWRSTDPKGLPVDPIAAVGVRNQEALTWLAQHAELVVAAWGQNKLNRYASVLGRRILALPHARCLGRNADGTPKHPLYLPAASTLISTLSHSEV